MMTYAGYPFTLLTDGMLPKVNRWWDRHAPDLWSYPGYNVDGMNHLPLPDRPSMPNRARLNVLYWPTGASRWGVFHGLMDVSRIAGLQSSTGGYGTTPVARDLIINDDVQERSITASMYLLTTRPVFELTAYPLFWVTLVDKRYYYWLRQLSYTFDPGDTWSELLLALAAAVDSPVPTIAGTIAAAYGSPSPRRWTIPSKPLPLLMDAAAISVGRRYVISLDGTTAEYTDYTTAQSVAQAQYDDYTNDITIGGRIQQVPGGAPGTARSMIGNVPANVAVVSWGDIAETNTVTLASLALSEYTGQNGVTGKYGFIQADRMAGTVSPSASSYATQAATDYYKWLLSLNDLTVRSVGVWESSGLEDRIEWEYVAEWTTEPTTKGIRWLTRIVPANHHDHNIYGDRPPVGWTYAVTLISNSGNLWKAQIQVSNSAGTAVEDGPQVGWNADDYVVLVPSGVTAATDDYGIAIPDPKRPNRWIFIPTSTTTSTSTDCTSCAWLNWIVEGDETSPPCWVFYRRGGQGRCACFATDDPTDANAGILGIWDTGLASWIGTAPMGEGTSAMIETCCGCGSIRLTVVGGVATLTLSGVHLSCNTSGEPPAAVVYTETATDYCCGVLEDGRRYIEFFYSSPESCSDGREKCDNTYKIMAVCDECIAPACNCVGCGTGMKPLAWLATITGFTDEQYNGDWVWTPTGDAFGCSYEAVCAEAGGTSTLVFTPSSPVGDWVLTHGGDTFEVAYANSQCASGMVLTNTDVMGSPATITLYPLGTGSGCCSGCDWDALQLKTLYFTIIGGTADGVVLTGTYDAMAGGFLFTADDPACPCAAGHGGYNIEGLMPCVDGVLDMAALIAKTTCQVAADDVILPTSCDPFYATGAGLFMFCIAGGSGTEAITWVISETAP